MDLANLFIQFLHNISRRIPLELFTLIGAFLEEIIAPIPSPFVMTSAGTIAESQGRAVEYIFLLALLGAVGKTIGSWLLYIVSDKAEDFIIKRFGKLIGIQHKEVEEIGKKFNGGKKDWFILFTLRAIPAIPTSPVSVVAGIIKIKLVTYLSASFVGTIVRNIIFLYIGYIGLSTAESLLTEFNTWETIGKLILGAVILTAIGYMYYKRSKK